MKRVCVVGMREAGLPVSQDEWRRRRDLDWLLSVGAFRSGPSRRFLMFELGLRWEASMNLLPPGSCWDAEVARSVARAARLGLEARFDAIVLCGSQVHAAFGYGRWKAPSVIAWAGTKSPALPSDASGLLKFILLPHPSGRCRAWNDEETRRLAKRLIQEYAT